MTARGKLGQREYQSAKPFVASVFCGGEKSAGVVDGEKLTQRGLKVGRLLA